MLVFRKNLFRVLAVLSTGSVFLNIVFQNLPWPFHTPTTFFTLYFLATLAFFPKIFVSKQIVPFYFFLMVYLIGFGFIWVELKDTFGGGSYEFRFFIPELLWSLWAILLYLTFLYSKDYKGLGGVVMITLLFIGVTSITSIIGLNIYPGATRMLASGSANDLTSAFRALGIGSFGFFTGATFLIPPFVYYLKNERIGLRLKTIISSFLFLLFYSTIKSELTTTLLIAALGFLLAALSRKKIPATALFILGFIFILMFFFRIEFGNFFINSANYFSDYHVLETRFRDLGNTILTAETGEGGGSYVTDVRLSLSKTSFQSFIKNPLFGGGVASGHAFWLDRLGLLGFFGVFPWILLFKNQLQLNFKVFQDNYKIFYVISFFSFILFGLIKSGLESPQTMVSMFFLVPAMYFLTYIKK